jgi:hypothetical protein
MNKLLILLSLLLVQCAFAQDAAIRKTVDTFFEGLHTADTLKMQSVCSDKLVLHTVYEKGGSNVLVAETTEGFYKSIAEIPAGLQIEERLLSFKVTSDGVMANAWTPYEFYINGKLSHSGVNSFSLYNDNGQWKIVYIIDTRKKP